MPKVSREWGEVIKKLLMVGLKREAPVLIAGLTKQNKRQALKYSLRNREDVSGGN